MKTEISITDIAAVISRAQEAQELLDSILSNWCPYSGEFKLSEWDKDYSQSHSLNRKIRAYTKFDDSE